MGFNAACYGELKNFVNSKNSGHRGLLHPGLTVLATYIYLYGLDSFSLPRSTSGCKGTALPLRLKSGYCFSLLVMDSYDADDGVGEC